ncbi:Aleurone layer morphogenesis protein [Melia azedarach]|uniref:Aleurone layer morphogenesis protein n=1 Tax=Melia azedarach TaxID=155640 RepID=A0ACC1YIT7_MELAZ|nr:Aleurone layer morphogenesis protein [Melia azedarach]
MADADICPTEDAVNIFLDHLVDPLLPARFTRDTPSKSQQQLVAKQVHAVVLLYNYYHRKQHQHLKFEGFESFCKLAVVQKPTLLAHLKLMQRSKDCELDDPETQLSVTEKTIMDACDICKSLDASKDVPCTEGWLISKIAVLLIDSRKEYCCLKFSSITQGVWSLIEKDVDVSSCFSEGTTEGKHIKKRIKVTRKSLRDGVDEVFLQQTAFSAVKEATGISQNDLIIVGSDIVYSLSKEKTTARFYMMQCTQPKNDDVMQVPVRDALESLQGPLVVRSSGQWTVTPVVCYFHLLPYAGIISDWLSREGLSNSFQDQSLELGSKLKRTEQLDEPDICDNQNRSHVNSDIVECLGSRTDIATRLRKRANKNGRCMDGLSGGDDNDGRGSVNVDALQNEDNCNNIDNRLKLDDEPDSCDNQNRSHVNSDTVEYLGSRADIITSLRKHANKNGHSMDGLSGGNDSDGRGGVNIDALQNEDKCKNIDNRLQLDGEPDIRDNQNRSHVNSDVVECLGSGADIITRFRKCANKIGCSMNGLSGGDDSDGRGSVNVDALQNEDKCKNIDNRLQLDDEPDIRDNQNRYHVNIDVVECLGSGADIITRLWKCANKNGRSMDGLSGGDDSDGRGSVNVALQNEDKCKNIDNRLQLDDHHKMKKSYLKSGLNGKARNKSKVEMAGSIRTECRVESVSDRKAASDMICSDEYEKPIGDCAAVIGQSNSKDIGRPQSTASLKENMSQTALRALLTRRNELNLQQRKIEDEIAVCDKKIQMILNSGGDDSGLKIEVLEEVCNDICLESSPQSTKMKRLSEAVLVKKNSCQELDDICYDNNWILPTYRVSPSEGGFQSQVTTKGIDFECSTAGDSRSNPREARESAAAQMLEKLRSMANHAQ